MKRIIVGKLIEAKTVDTKNGKGPGVVVEVEERVYNKDSNETKTEKRSVWYFNNDRATIGDWALEAGNKNKGNIVILAVSEGTGGVLHGEEVPRSRGLIRIPTMLKTFENAEEGEALFNDFNAKLCAVIEKGELPEDYSVDTSRAANIVDCVTLLRTIESEEAKEAVKAANALLVRERVAFIGIAAGVKDDEKKASVFVALPTKEGEETKWATFSFFNDPLKSSAIKNINKGNVYVLFGTNETEYNGRKYYVGTGFRFLYKRTPKEGAQDTTEAPAESEETAE